MRKFLTLLLVMAVCGDCTIAQTTDDKAREDRNKKTALEIFNAYQAGKTESIFKNYDNQVTFIRNGMSAPRPIALDTFKRNAVQEYTRWKTSFPDGRQQVVASAADGNYVMLFFNETGTWKNDFAFWKASGKTYKMNDVLVFKFNDEGKVIEQQFMVPQTAIMDQISDGAEFELNRVGYALLAQKKMADAIEVFKLNVKLYPQSSNTYDSLGEAYALAGNKPLAIENYEKSIQLDPKNEGGKTMLEKLKKQ